MPLLKENIWFLLSLFPEQYNNYLYNIYIVLNIRKNVEKI
jgi:hypothetical protein